VAEEIYINQTLHGYNDGHQLLAASVDLDSNSQSLILIMSDLSGPSFRDGYDSYLTGYSLSGSGYFCLGRTWFAPERPRPGCVWTHTLLIKDEDMARIRNFCALKQLFQRPAYPDITTYHQSIPFDPRTECTSSWFGDVRSVLHGLYDSPRNIVIPSDSSEPYDNLVLLLLDQQWPKLRRSFRFCTGALSVRDNEFDLSVSPPEVTHSVGRAGVVLDQQESPRAHDAWLEHAWKDLLGGVRDGPYRRFLWRFGPDNYLGREGFRPLTEIFLVLDSDNEPQCGDRLLSAVAYFFPEEQKAPRLKKELFGQDSPYKSRLGGEGGILRLLVGHPAASAIGFETLQIFARARALAKENFSEGIDIAVRSLEIRGEIALSFIEGFLAGAEWTSSSLELAPYPLVPLVLSRDPSFLHRPAVWNREDRLKILDQAVIILRREAHLISGTVSAMMQVAAWDAILELLEQIGSSVANTLFEYVENRVAEELEFPDELLLALASTWFEVKDSAGPRSLKLLSTSLDPRSWAVRQVAVSRWVAASRAELGVGSPIKQRRSAVFFLAIGLSTWDASGAELVVATFGDVYRAAKSNELESALWEKLEPFLVWYSPTWDKCARLIKTIACTYKDRQWPLEAFFKIFRSAEEFSRAVDDINSIWGGARFLRRLKEVVRSNGFWCSPEQREVLFGRNF